LDLSADYTVGRVWYDGMAKEFSQFTVMMKERTKTCDNVKKKRAKDS
jgi:hypothetical protein